MKIYFTGITEEKNFSTGNKKYNGRIVSALRAIRHEVIEDDSETDFFLYRHLRFARRLNKCDCLVAEITGDSLRLGSQLCYSGTIKKKPTYVFFDKTQREKVSLIILQDPHISKIPYSDEEDISNLVRTIFPLKKSIEEAVKKFEQQKLMAYVG